MGFFRKSGKRSYDLFSGYGHYVPGIGGMFMMFLMFLIGSLLGNFVVLGLTAISADFAKVYGAMLSYPVMFIPPMLYASSQSRKNEAFEKGYALDSNNFGSHRWWVLALAAAFSTTSLAFCVEPLMKVLPEAPQWFEDIMDTLLKDTPLWVTLISVSVFAPFFEEWLCRGIVLRGLLTRMSPAAAITISAAFFAVLHLNPWQALPAFLLGLWFGFIYYKTGSLKLVMLMHFANNTMSALFAQAPQYAEAETFMDIMSPWAYAAVFALSVIILASSALIFRSISMKGSAAGNCDEIAELPLE
ncbi:MAG: lysostaphin resistance A-like protein [Candidatus Cryptobacteroides sp.]